MISNARRTLAWTLTMSLAGCALDGDPAYDDRNLAPLAAPPASEQAQAPAAAQEGSEAAALAPSPIVPTELAPQAAAPLTAATDSVASSSTPAPAPATPAAPPSASTPTQPSTATQLTGVIANVGSAHGELGLAGQGTLGLTAKVRISELLAGAGLSALAEVAVDAQGSFSAQLPAHGKLLVAQALDAAGHVLGGAIVALPADVSGELALAPITVESSLALKLFLQAAALPCTEQSSPALAGLALDASLLASSGLSAELSAALAGRVDGPLALDALTKAFVMGHQARRAVLLEADVAVDGDRLLDAALEALAKLNASTSAALSGKLDIERSSLELVSNLELGLRAAGAADEVRARAQVAASLGLGASLRASLAADASLQPLLFPALHAAAQLEVQAALPTIASDLIVSGASEQLSAKLRAAGNELALEVRAATDLGALRSARAKYLKKLYRDPASQGLVLDLLGATTSIVTGVLDPVLATLDTLTAQLDVRLAVSLQGSAGAGLCTGGALSVELDTSLQDLVDTLLDFQADVRVASAKLTPSGQPQQAGNALADVLATAELLLRVAP